MMLANVITSATRNLPSLISEFADFQAVINRTTRPSAIALPPVRSEVVAEFAARVLRFVENWIEVWVNVWVVIKPAAAKSTPPSSANLATSWPVQSQFLYWLLVMKGLCWQEITPPRSAIITATGCLSKGLRLAQLTFAWVTRRQTRRNCVGPHVAVTLSLL